MQGALCHANTARTGQGCAKLARSHSCNGFCFEGNRVFGHLRGGREHLAEALIPAEKEGAITALVDTGQRHRSAKGEAEFIAGEGRDAARVRLRPAVEKIARVERCNQVRYQSVARLVV